MPKFKVLAFAPVVLPSTITRKELTMMFVCVFCYLIYSRRQSTPFGIYMLVAPVGTTQEEGQHGATTYFEV